MKKESNNTSWARLLNSKVPVVLGIACVALYIAYLTAGMGSIAMKHKQVADCENATLAAATNQFGRTAKAQQRLDGEADKACKPQQAAPVDTSVGASMP